MNPRAGILVTGTEVLSGIISDRNGPWLSERLREIGLDPAVIQIVADRPHDLFAALEWMADQNFAVVVTSGGLGPTADDLTAEIVGRFADREMVLDPRLEERIAQILESITARWPGLDQAAIRESNRKQALIPRGASVLDPVGTAPGLVVPPADGQGPVVVVLPGPPRELQPMWKAALATPPMKAILRDLPTYHREIVRLFGLPESEIANTLRAAEHADSSSNPSRSRPVYAAERSRSPPATSLRPSPPMTRSSSLFASAMASGSFRKTAQRSTSRSRSYSPGTRWRWPSRAREGCWPPA